MLMMTIAGPDSSWTAILPGTLVAMFGTGMFNPSVSAVALGSAPQDMSGLAAGVNDTFRQAGIAVGVAAFGAMMPADVLAGGSAAEFVDSLHVALVSGAGLAAVGAVAAARLIGGRRSGAAPARPALEAA
jgi:hypothetical protein